MKETIDQESLISRRPRTTENIGVRGRAETQLAPNQTNMQQFYDNPELK